MPALFTTSTTAQNIMDAVARDVRQSISSTATPDSVILLDYVNRVSEELLRASKFIFLLSAPQQFITQLNVSSYWVGPNQTGPLDAYDTSLNLTDLRIVKPKSVIDRSNFRYLGHTDESPVAARLAFSDSTSRVGRPAEWRQDESSPFVINIYPAPDNQNTYTPVPYSPICTRLLGGPLLARFYYITTTYIDSFGNESTAPPPAKIFIPAGSTVLVNPPVSPVLAATDGVQYNRYNVYALEAPGNITPDVSDLTLQFTAIGLSTGNKWNEPTTGLTTNGANPPSENMLEPLDGYVIEFRYFQQRVPIIAVGQILQVPDDYKDVVIAGVNAVTFMYLTRPTEAMHWYQLYKDGISQIIRDINFMSRGGGYIQPDPTTTGNFLPTVETIDLSVLSP